MPLLWEGVAPAEEGVGLVLPTLSVYRPEEKLGPGGGPPVNVPALVWLFALLAFLTALAGALTERFQRTAMVLSAVCVIASVAIGIG
ncbi:MAG TPA: hypothetical protein GX517_09710 [Alicyclobacillus sp.]|nr:hypothetical protein [Alicyclobacillus sp.]